jgi:hypothetical protein
MTPGERSTYEDLRQKLIAQGYLEGRIERFVLGDLLTGPAGFGRVIKTALRAAVIGGPALGALLAGAVAATNRPLHGVSDLTLLWLYFTIMAVVALFVADLVGAVIVTALARHRRLRRGDSFRAALFVGLPTLGYLSLWWLTRARAGTPGDALFLTLAVSTTALVAWLASLVSVADLAGRTDRVPQRGKRSIVLLFAVLTPLACLGVLTHGLVVSPHDPFELPGFDVADEGAKQVLLVGIDGLDIDLIDAVQQRGGLTRLGALLERATVFPLVRDEAAEPPEVWTTIMTGRLATDHGIKSVGMERLPGVATPLSRRATSGPLLAALGYLLPTRTVTVSGATRQVRTLWEIVALRQPATAVGWWASWPAMRSGEVPDTYVVTDRVLPKLISGAAGEQDTLPPALYTRLAGEFDTDRQALRQRFEQLFDLPADDQTARWVWESYLIDSYNWRVTRRLIVDDARSTAFVYLPGLDILRNRLGGTGDALDAYLSWLDSLTDDLVAVSDGNLMLIADPGRGELPPATGFMAILGMGTLGGCAGDKISGLALTPLTLSLLGFPASDEMPGHLPATCLGDLAARQARIPSYGLRNSGSALPESEFEAEMFDRLRSLGYLK